MSRQACMIYKKRQGTDWEKPFLNYIPYNGLIFCVRIKDKRIIQKQRKSIRNQNLNFC